MTTRRRGAQTVIGKSSRFGFGLLLYLLLAIALFILVGRYMPHLARRVGHIRHGWLRFSIYFVIYAVAALAVAWGARRIPWRLSRERALQLCFVGGAALSTAVAVYQNRFGTGLSATYFTVGVLGAFAGVLMVTQADFGLVEVNAPPAPEVVAAVRRAHQRIALANHLWDHMKRAIEAVVASALIVLTLPISIVLAIIIWLLDPGPLFVAKIAVTRGGKSFRQLKLRSMIKNAEQTTGAVPASPDDERITMLGRLLRRTHIDELPQMVNIALGDMSLVGPRPDRTVFAYRNLQTLPRYPERHAVRPGLSGLAQVYGDYYSTPREKLRYDLLYIQRRSFGLDARLFVTAALLGLLGIAPGVSRGRRRYMERHQDERWHRAYEALHGGSPDGAPPPRRKRDRREPALAGRFDRMAEADDRSRLD